MSNRINEVKLEGSEYISFSTFLYNIYKSICRIFLPNNSIGSGFLMKYERDNTPFYFLLTSNYIISERNIQSNSLIKIYYNNQNNNILITLNKNERLIQDFNYLGIDATLVEILPQDNVDKNFFLSPNLNYLNGYNNYKFEKINIIKYHHGADIKYVMSEIINIIDDSNEFIYKLKGKLDSLGCPIFLEDSNFVLGIQTKPNKKEGKANFIGPILNFLNKNYIYGKKKEENYIYEGELKNNKREGFGKCIYENTITYIGQWSNDQINGKGKIYKKNNNLIYEGDFVNGKFEGEGKFFDKNGGYYIGEFLNNKKHGKGKMYYSNGQIQYEGNFVNDKYEGEGKYYYKTGKYYEGNFYKNKKHGKGILYYKNGGINYIGDFKDDKYEGNGKYIFKNGYFYVGEWTNNKRNGQGKIFNNNEEIIKEGIFVNDKYSFMKN